MLHVRLSVTVLCTCLIAGIAGGAFGAYRTAHSITATVVDWDGLRETTAAGDGPGTNIGSGTDAAIDRVRWVDGHAALRLVAPDWRPLIIRLEVARPQDASPEPVVLTVETDGWPHSELRLPPGRSTHTLTLWHPPRQREKLHLRMFHRAGAKAVGLVRLDVFPDVRWGSTIKHAVGGFLAGVLFAGLWLVVRLPARRAAVQAHADPPADAFASPGSMPAASTLASLTIGKRLVIFAGVAAYLSVWASVKPILQAPDEPQHLMKANAVLRQPWLTAAAQFEHEPRFLNPLALWPPHELGRVFYHGGATLSGADLDVLKRFPWTPEDRPREPTTYRVALASYPPVYYLSTFLLSQPVIAAAGASAYQAVFIYRFATVLLAAIVWTAVYVELRRTADLRSRVLLLFVFLLANPMLAFVSAAVNTDALAIPLCIGGALAGWRLFTTGEGGLRTLLWLTAAALVKPAGLQMICALAAAALVTWYWWQQGHIAVTLVTLGRALATSFALFYAWSYIHLYASPPQRPGPMAYASASLKSLADVWIMYWGKLGWLDYALPNVFYVLLLAPIAWCVREAWRRPALSRPAQCFFILCFFGFAATMYAVEYTYLHESGYFIQGRYFLPGAIGLAPLLFHRGAAARVTLVASVVLLNALLLVATVHRYYADDWRLVWRALPMEAVHDPAIAPATDALTRHP